ncbi:MAG TPA: tryptophan--tRNA ligase [Candidatus Paceibacterota bacterium]|nr:tryptophan--tRNA ligase [Candidatus Paceibacterota bacterium]
MKDTRKTLLSGVKPTGRPHIGNYFGAMKQFADMQHEFNSIYMIADYHALNTTQSKNEMRESILDVALDYLAIGLDPKKSVIFKQSDVSAHTELAWIFDTLTTMPYLMRAHAFKDAEAKNKEINVGTFNYPMLMAADILLYDADVVPVGQDQKQHIEIARDTAEKFNRVFKEDVFTVPEPLIMESVAVVPGTDGQKMSKSYGNTIPLFAIREEITKAVMSIVTDSSGGVPQNVYAIHALIKDKPSLDALYEEKAGKYKDLKEALIEDLDAFIAPLRARRDALAQDEQSVISILTEGGERAKAIAEEKMKLVRKAIGVTL